MDAVTSIPRDKVAEMVVSSTNLRIRKVHEHWGRSLYEALVDIDRHSEHDRGRDLLMELSPDIPETVEEWAAVIRKMGEEILRKREEAT